MLRVVTSGILDEKTRNEMHVSRKRFRLARLLRSTEKILTYAQQGDWAVVEELENQRQLELAACFSESDADDSPEVIEALAALVTMNREITRLVEAAKVSLLENQRDDERRQQAIRCYDWND
ncbi:MAG: flagellar protein FliT [Gammaproteobacteria bacterium]|nr:flagellar protein FliT [Pseudomonadales bacterium]MCP5349014.1 flagellar protein FliT [Pseudomonadales bacterium]